MGGNEALDVYVSADEVALIRASPDFGATRPQAAGAEGVGNEFTGFRVNVIVDTSTM